jgi:hypothetical protein
MLFLLHKKNVLFAQFNVGVTLRTGNKCCLMDHGSTCLLPLARFLVPLTLPYHSLFIHYLAIFYRAFQKSVFRAWLAAVQYAEPNKTLIVVSNEVGLSIVPPYSLGRVYRDTLGYVNQRLAQVADRVYLMLAGVAVDIKRLHEEASL